MIELCFVLSMLSLFLMFISDTAMQLLTRGELDRISYSLVSVVKERSRFFVDDENHPVWPVSKQEADDLREILARRTTSGFVVIVESAYEDALGDTISNSFTSSGNGGQALAAACGQGTELAQSPLFTQLANDSGVKLATYRVTVCQQSPNYFNPTGQPRVIQSSAVMVGR